MIGLSLNAAGVALVALVATFISGEYHQSWLYLFADLAEAAFGLAAGLAVSAVSVSAKVISKKLWGSRPRLSGVRQE
jgi:hypothetical protein